jgi:two-component system CheB/CheR fusion protein
MIFGFEHEIVSNGKLAIEKMQTNTYDIILMDLQMPEMRATEYIRKTLKSHSNHCIDSRCNYDGRF